MHRPDSWGGSPRPLPGRYFAAVQVRSPTQMLRSST